MLCTSDSPDEGAQAVTSVSKHSIHPDYEVDLEKGLSAYCWKMEVRINTITYKRQLNKICAIA